MTFSHPQPSNALVLYATGAAAGACPRRFRRDHARRRRDRCDRQHRHHPECARNGDVARHRHHPLQHQRLSHQRRLYRRPDRQDRPDPLVPQGAHRLCLQRGLQLRRPLAAFLRNPGVAGSGARTRLVDYRTRFSGSVTQDDGLAAVICGSRTQISDSAESNGGKVVGLARWIRLLFEFFGRFCLTLAARAGYKIPRAGGSAAAYRRHQ